MSKDFAKSLKKDGYIGMKGIILAGGAGTRLYPLTMVTSNAAARVRQAHDLLSPLHADAGGDQDILIISPQEDCPRFCPSAGDGSQFGIRLSTRFSPRPTVWPRLSCSGRRSSATTAAPWCWGDNIFYGNLVWVDCCARPPIAPSRRGDHLRLLGARSGALWHRRVRRRFSGATLGGRETRPAQTTTPSPGCISTTVGSCRWLKQVRPSPRGGWKSPTLNACTWPAALLSPAAGPGLRVAGHGHHGLAGGGPNFVQMVEKRQGIKISAPEEIAYKNRWIAGATARKRRAIRQIPLRRAPQAGGCGAHSLLKETIFDEGNSHKAGRRAHPLEPQVFGDHRGWFTETYSQQKLRELGVEAQFVQRQPELHRPQKGTLRGLHFQNDPMAQAKLVRVVRGAVLDVAVDIRRGSPQYCQWVGVELSAENKRQLWIPGGFAHGFVT